MCAIDFSHKITPRKVIFAKIQKTFFFCKKLLEKSQKSSFFLATLYIKSFIDNCPLPIIR
jgi:hypothetical protein